MPSSLGSGILRPIPLGIRNTGQCDRSAKACANRQPGANVTHRYADRSSDPGPEGNSDCQAYWTALHDCLLTSRRLRAIVAPITTPIAMPTASHAPPDPRATAIAVPMPAPSAIPSPICTDGSFIFKISECAPPLSRSLRRGVGILTLVGQECPTHGLCYFPFDFPPGGKASCFGDLSPMPRTFESSSLIFMPESVSNSAGT